MADSAVALGKYQKLGKDSVVAPDELEPGDVLIKYIDTKSLVNQVIRFSQTVLGGSKHANKVHAAMFISGDTLIEAQGEGIVKSSLQTHLNEGLHYKVYRCNDPKGAQAAVEFAEQQVGRSYDFKGLPAAAARHGKKDLAADSEERGLLSGNRDGKFYCSGLVTAAFNSPAIDGKHEVYLGVDEKSASPQALELTLQGHDQFQYLGKLSK